jgi:hypothetical protein
MYEYKYELVAEISNLDLGFVPTSVFLNGVQSFAYTIQDTMIYFDTVLAVGTIIVATPPDAIRSLNDSVATVTIEDIGVRSVFSMPFGRAEFSLDGVIWATSLQHTFPATIYCRPAPHDVVLDCTCKVDTELVVFNGGANVTIDSFGNVSISEVALGGLEYELY